LAERAAFATNFADEQNTIENREASKQGLHSAFAQ